MRNPCRRSRGSSSPSGSRAECWKTSSLRIEASAVCQQMAHGRTEFPYPSRVNAPAGNVDAIAASGAREISLRTLSAVLAASIGYYLATRTAWVLTFPDSKVSLFFPPHAVLVSILLLVPTRHWWAYLLAAVSSHFLATQQEQWPLAYALQCEAFDAF